MCVRGWVGGCVCVCVCVRVGVCLWVCVGVCVCVYVCVGEGWGGEGYASSFELQLLALSIHCTCSNQIIYKMSLLAISVPLHNKCTSTQ